MEELIKRIENILLDATCSRSVCWEWILILLPSVGTSPSYCVRMHCTAIHCQATRGLSLCVAFCRIPWFSNSKWLQLLGWLNVPSLPTLKQSTSHSNYSERSFLSSGTFGRCFSSWWSWGPATGVESATLQRPATQLQTTTQTTSWWASLFTRSLLNASIQFQPHLFPFYCPSTEWANVLHRGWNSVHGCRSRFNNTLISLVPLGLGQMI